MTPDIGIGVLIVFLAVAGGVLSLLLTPNAQSTLVSNDHQDPEAVDWRHHVTDLQENHWL